MTIATSAILLPQLHDVRRVIAFVVCLITCAAALPSAQDRPHYRGYRMGDDIQAITAQSGVAPPIASLIPRQPLMLKELEWRPRYVRGAAFGTDPVARLTFGFFNDQLFRIVIDYEHDRTEGMTEADMVGAISEAYGPPARRLERSHPVREEFQRDVDLLIARWDDEEYSVTLLSVPSSSAFRLIVTSTRLVNLAHSAGAGPVPLDAPEPPQRDVPRRPNDVQDAQSAQRKARLANKAAFTP